VEATASRSCTLPRVHTLLDITCIEHPSVSTGQELSGHCLGRTSSHDHTSACSTKQFLLRRAPHSPHSPYMSIGRECLDAVCSTTPSLDHTSVCMRRGPEHMGIWRPWPSDADPSVPRTKVPCTERMGAVLMSFSPAADAKLTALLSTKRPSFEGWCLDPDPAGPARWQRGPA
jgi:hypothetical protein